jgi:hypothetical protein
MATNNPRHGYERKRSQTKTKTMSQKHWTKRSRETGEFYGSEEGRQVQIGASGKERVNEDAPTICCLCGGHVLRLGISPSVVGQHQRRAAKCRWLTSGTA